MNGGRHVSARKQGMEEAKKKRAKCKMRNAKCKMQNERIREVVVGDAEGL
jgi:hypothetical protein